MTDTSLALKTRVDVRLVNAIEEGTLPKRLLIEGPAGTGKTFGILKLLHLLACDYPDLRILVCRQTRVSLTESVLVSFEKYLLPEDSMEWLAAGVTRKGRTSYLYPNGSEIVLGGLDNPARIYSTDWDIIYPNEAIELGEEAWDTLWSRLNRPGRSPLFGFLLADTNPGDPSHWINKRCNAGEITRWRTNHQANPILHDGQDWTEAGRFYVEDTLGKLLGTRRKRLLEGLWAAGEGQWFETFDTLKHVSPEAEYDARYPVHLAVDTGVHTGAVWFQVRGEGTAAQLTVFADYYSDKVPAYQNALAILERSHKRVPNRKPLMPWIKERQDPGFDVGRMDPSGNANNGTGLVIGTEFSRAGLKLQPWNKFPGCIASRLALLESFVATETPSLLIHPRCSHTIEAFANYKRKKRGRQWIDEPEDPQHPHEEMIDALGSGLLDKFPEGRKVEVRLPRIHPRNLF